VFEQRARVRRLDELSAVCASFAAGSSWLTSSSPTSSIDTVSARSRRRIIRASLSATRVIHALKWPVGL
jgi:hypothetical protein